MSSFLSFTDILRLIRELNPPLVEGLDDYQLKPVSDGGTAEGPCVELRIGKVFSYDSNEIPVLNYDFPQATGNDRVVRYVPPALKLMDLTPSSTHELGQEFNLKRGDTVVVQSIEHLNLPNTDSLSILAVVEPRFSLSRMGVLLAKSDADPGYTGPIIFRLYNLGPFETVRLGLGARVAKLRFVRINGRSPSYVGQYGGQPGDIDERRG